MKGKIIAVLIIINLILVGGIYNLINKENVNNQKQIIKEMTQTEFDNNIKSLNASHEEYANYIEESKKKIASAITDMGIETSNEENLETMANNIKNIARDASSISYDNTNGGLTATNVQGAIDELKEDSNWKFLGEIKGSNSFSDDFTKYNEVFLVCYLYSAGTFFQHIPTVILNDTTTTYNVTAFSGTYGSASFAISMSKTLLSIYGAVTNDSNVKANSTIKIYAK